MKLSTLLSCLIFFYSLSRVKSFTLDTDINVPVGVINCEADGIQIVFDHNYLENLNIDISTIDDMFLTSDPSDPFSNFDPACVAQSLSDRYEFDLNATDASRCAYLVETVDGIIIFCFQVHIFRIIDVSTPIVRFLKFKWELYCEYQNKKTLNFQPLTPLHRKNRILTNAETGDFTVQMERQNATFSAAVALDEIVLVPNPIYIQATLATGINESNLVLQARNCYATPTAWPNDTARMDIIENNCVAADPVSYGMNQVFQNFENEVVQFRFNSFYWTNVSIIEAEIYVHCCFKICDTRLSSECFNDNCERKKRDVDSTQHSLSMEKETQMTATFGPIQIQKPAKKVNALDEAPSADEIKVEEAPKIVKDLKIDRFTEIDSVCDKKQEGCSFDCGLVDATKVVCVCPPGFGLEEDGKTCFQYYPEVKKEVESYSSDYTLPASALVVALGCYILILTTKISEG